jgi:hypothetical protein
MSVSKTWVEILLGLSRLYDYLSSLAHFVIPLQTKLVLKSTFFQAISLGKKSKY